MSRSRASNTCVENCRLAFRFFAAALALAAVVLTTGLADARSTRILNAGPTVAGISNEGTVDAIPRRLDPQVDNERRVFDDGMLSFPRGDGWSRFVVPSREVPSALVGPDALHDQQISRFRRRIPRMNADDPPWA
jgi:hypothetical protein